MAELAAAALVGGCSTDNNSTGNGTAGPNPNPPSPLPTGYQLATGSVNQTEIGGTGLRIHSVVYPNAPVDSGAFTTVVSTAGAQLLLVADYPANGNPGIRGLAMNAPGDGRLTVDAASTALALTTLTFGILTVDPAEAAARRTTILGLASFAPFVSYLRQVLPTTDLSTLNSSDSRFSSLRTQLSNDFIATLQAAPAAAARKAAVFAPRVASFATGRVDGTYTAPKNPGDPATVALSNYGFRFVEVVRRTVGPDGVEVGSPVVPTLTGAQNPSSLPNLISGINLLSWGNLLVPGQADNPGTATDSFPVDPKVAEVDYYVSGPGVPVGGAALPSDVSSSMFSGGTIQLTVFFYFMGPLLDYYGGGENVLKQLRNETAEFVGQIAGISVNQAGFDAALNSANAENVASSIVDIETAVLGLIQGVTVGLVAAGVLAADAPLVVAIGAAASLASLFTLLFGLTNLVNAAGHLITVPGTGKLPVPVNAAPSFNAATVVASQFGAIGSNQASVNKLGHVLYQTTTETQSTSNGSTTITDVSSLLFWSAGQTTVIGNPLTSTSTNNNASGSAYDLESGSCLNDLDQLIFGVLTVNGSTETLDAFFQPALTGASATPQAITGNGPVGPTAVNNLGSVVGREGNQNPDLFVWNNGAIQQRFAPPSVAQDQEYIAINDNNVVVVAEPNDGSYTNFTVTLYDTSGGTTTAVSTTAAGNAPSINNAGQVGYTELLQDGTPRAALWTAAVGKQLLPLLPGDTQSALMAVNNNGDAIGTSGSNLVYWRGSNVFALNNLILTSGVTLGTLLSFSNGGHVLGIAADQSTGSNSLILLTPVAPSGSASS